MENVLDKLKRAMMGQTALPQENMMSPIDPNVVEEAQSDAATAQVNDQAKSPNMMTPPELEQKQMQEESKKTVEGQLQERQGAAQIDPVAEVVAAEAVVPQEPTMQEKLRQNIAKYEALTNKPQESKWQDSLPDILAGAHNILNYSQNTGLKNLKLGSADKAQATRAAAKQTQLGNLQKLQQMYQKSIEGENKGNLTAYQKAQLESGNKDRALKEKIAKLTKKTKAKPRTKLEEEREKDIAERFSTLEEQRPNSMASIEEANFLIKELEKGNISTGPGSKLAGNVGAFFDTDESNLKERLDSLAEKAARAQLKANGETRPTDADVEGMKTAMFNLGNTETTNIGKLKDFIKQQEAGLNEYDQMKAKLDNGEGLEDFLLKPTYTPKPTNEVKRRTKDGQVAVFDSETKKFIRYEK